MDKPIKIFENGVLIGEHTYQSYRAIQLSTPEERLTAMVEAHREETRAEIGSLRRQLGHLLELTIAMRKAQKEYFKHRTQENLIAAKQLETALDLLLKELEAIWVK